MVIYCDNVISRRTIEPDYEAESEAAAALRFDVSLISFDELTGGHTSSALKLVRASEHQTLGVYRGWMLTPEQYATLYDGLLEKNIVLINSPAEYQHCHYLPDSYQHIEKKTPYSRWTTDLTENGIQALAAEFGQSAVVVKDFVKSEKHHWQEACFIPDASDNQRVQSITERFIALRGSSLNKGLVFRKFEELELLTTHAKSGMPLTREYRIFFAHQQVVDIYHYWSEAKYGDTEVDVEPFIQIAQSIKSNFFTMDIAKKKDGDWIIVELGDGQVAGLPDHADVEAFYRNLKEIIT